MEEVMRGGMDNWHEIALPGLIHVVYNLKFEFYFIFT